MSKIRRAEVTIPDHKSRDEMKREVANYLPSNYKVIGRRGPDGGILIEGVDDHGWTLDAYVIPRLASGLIACCEVLEEERRCPNCGRDLVSPTSVIECDLCQGGDV